MTKDRYVIMARYWNLDHWEVARKTAKNRTAALGAMKVLIDNTSPYQVSYTDTMADHPKDDPSVGK